MDHKGLEKAAVETACVDVVILSAACCNPSMGGLDEQARKVIERAADQAGVHAHVKVQPISAALYGGVPKDVAAQLRKDDRAGGMRVPVVIVNGKGVSYGVPDAELISAALRELAGAAPSAK
jgi:hypothetical protein